MTRAIGTTSCFPIVQCLHGPYWTHTPSVNPNWVIASILCLDIRLLCCSTPGSRCRGAVTIGEVHLSPEICFGKAIIQAYQLERKPATPPRIILDDPVLELVKRHIGWYSPPSRSPQNRELLIDEDNKQFVNYLDCCDYTGEGPDWEMVRRHRDFVNEQLQRFRDCDRVLRKYQWIRDYHNYFCLKCTQWTPGGTQPDGTVRSLLIDCDSDEERRFCPLVEGPQGGFAYKFRC